MTYRAVPITQRDGSPLANSNCRMAAIATGIDHHSLGAIVSTGAEMRSRQSDQVGGTDSGDASEAWLTYGQVLDVGDGGTWADLLDELREGRGVQLDVWHAAARGPCLSGSGAYGHSMAIAPERSGSRLLVADPWCSPARWTWWEESLLRAGAEQLGSQAYTAATAGGRPRSDRELVARMRRAVRALMTRYRPDAPAIDDPPEVAGSGGMIFYTATKPQGGIEADMAINAAAGMVTGLRADVPAGLDFYRDANLRERLGSMAKSASVVYVGNPIGETVEGGARAILVNTSSAYNDGSVRPTIVYVAAEAIDPVSVPTPPPSDGDVTEAIEIRDAEWRERIIDQLSPGAFEG